MYSNVNLTDRGYRAGTGYLYQQSIQLINTLVSCMKVLSLELTTNLPFRQTVKNILSRLTGKPG